MLMTMSLDSRSNSMNSTEFYESVVICVSLSTLSGLKVEQRIEKVAP